MKKIFDIFKHPVVLSILGLFALALFIWFVGPLFAFADHEPLGPEANRLTAIGTIFFIWVISQVWKFFKSKKKNDQVLDEITEASGTDDQDVALSVADQASQDEVQTINERFKEALDVLKKTRLGGASGRKFLYQLPWYIIIGPPGSGKTTLLHNSDLKFPLADRFGNDAVRGVGGTRNCDWWFAENAVLIDTAGRYTTQDSQEDVDRSAWTGFIELLQKYRRRRPINGAIIAVSISDLLELNEEGRQAHANAIRKRIHELYETLKIRFPVYLIFTKSDLLAGFMEYFDDLDRETRSHVWGMTFPLDDDPAVNAIDQLDVEFGLLEQHLQNRLIEKLENERNSERRDLIYTFPQQFSAIKDTVSQFSREIFQPTRYQHPAMIRGVYFTSATQEGSPIDRIMGSLANNFGLDRQNIVGHSGGGKSYFINRLLSNVIFQESGLAGANLKLEKKRAWFQHGAAIGILALTVLASLSWFYSYTRNKSFINEISSQATELQLLVDEGSVDENDILATLPILSKSKDLSDRKHSKLLSLGLSQDEKLGQAGETVYRKMLMQVFLPRLITRLEQQIQQNGNNADYLFEILKAYLMLDDSKHYDPESIRAWITLDWDKSLPMDVTNDQRTALVAHLDELFKTRPVPLPRSLNAGIVEQARGVLASAPIQERVYGRLKLELAQSDIKEFRLTEAAGRDAPLVFARESGTPLNKGIPGLFTFKGYHELFLPESEQLTKRIADESWIFGESHQINPSGEALTKLREDVLKLYLVDYSRHWEAFLSDIRIASFANLTQAVEILNILSGNNSPLRLLLEAVERETTLDRQVSAEKTLLDKAGEKFEGAKDKLEAVVRKTPINLPTSGLRVSASSVTERFKGLNELVQSKDGNPPPLNATLSILNELYVYLNSITQASGEELVLDQRKQIAQVLQRVKTASRRQPFPVSAMMESVVNGSSSLVSGDICQHINSTWRNDVYTFCTAAINGRYPINRGSKTDITQEDFGLFFGPGGKVDEFFKKYLSSSVDKSGSNWRWSSSASSCISDASLLQFKYADVIKNTFFRTGGQIPSVSFSMKPITMSENITQLSLDIDGQILNYDHGPVRVVPMKWPGPINSGQVSLRFLPPMGGASGMTLEGPWALFRLFDKGSLVKSKSERFIAKFKLQGRSATFELRASSAVNPFAIKELQQFRCPQNL